MECPARKPATSVETIGCDFMLKKKKDFRYYAMWFPPVFTLKLFYFILKFTQNSNAILTYLKSKHETLCNLQQNWP